VKSEFKYFILFHSVTIDDFFVSGVLIDVGPETSQFVTGQLFGLSDAEDPVKFVGGQTEDGAFVPGQTTKGVFYPGNCLAFLKYFIWIKNLLRFLAHCILKF
jgi:hypothetical protein